MAEITVAIPTHNRRETVLMAVRSALAQTRSPRRVMVLADGCTDDTVQACRGIGDERVEVLDLPKGPRLGYLHRNIPFEQAEIVAWLGDDDLWMPDHLARVGELFDATDVEIVGATTALVDPADAVTATGSDWRVPYLLQRYLDGEPRTPASAVTVRSQAALRVGGWREDPPPPGDMDLWTRILRDGARPGYVSVPTVVYFKAGTSGRGPAVRPRAWEERVDQNTRFFERILDAGEVVRLRHELVLAASIRDADMERARRQLDGWMPALNNELQETQRAVEVLRRERDEAVAELAAARAVDTQRTAARRRLRAAGLARARRLAARLRR